MPKGIPADQAATGFEKRAPCERRVSAARGDRADAADRQAAQTV